MTRVEVVKELRDAIGRMTRPAVDRYLADSDGYFIRDVDGCLQPDPNGKPSFGSSCRYLANTGEKCWIGQLFKIYDESSEGAEPWYALKLCGRADAASPSDANTDYLLAEWKTFLYHVQGLHDECGFQTTEDFRAHLHTQLKNACVQFYIPYPSES